MTPKCIEMWNCLRDCLIFCSENDEAHDRNQAMASALATFLRQVGVQLSGKNSTALERCQTFVAKDKKIFRFTKTNKKVRSLCENSKLIL